MYYLRLVNFSITWIKSIISTYIYISFEEAFLDEEITVDAIKDLSDEQLQKLGVVKIGWQKNIMQAAQRF